MGSNDTKKQALWRMEPNKSWSDWKIVVTRSNDESAPVDTYHVHKNILGAGPRKCDYFEAAFNAVNLKESKTCSTEISLPAAAAEIFPIFLDFVYGHREASDHDYDYDDDNASYALSELKEMEKAGIDATKAVALRHLANYFGIQKLENTAFMLIRRSLGGGGHAENL